MKKRASKQIAAQRVSTIINSVLKSKDGSFSDQNVLLAKRIIEKYKIKIPFEYKMLFCKNCKKFIVPGNDSTIRIGRSRIKALRITCKLCGHTYRKVIESNKKIKIEKNNDL
jgi:ribonuclease P protein subunit RPR2